MPRMRPLECLLLALSKVVSSPSSAAGYEEMIRCYESARMMEESESVSFLISEKFRAYDSNIDAEQPRDDREVR